MKNKIYFGKIPIGYIERLSLASSHYYKINYSFISPISDWSKFRKDYNTYEQADFQLKKVFELYVNYIRSINHNPSLAKIKVVNAGIFEEKIIELEYLKNHSEANWLNICYNDQDIGLIRNNFIVLEDFDNPSSKKTSLIFHRFTNINWALESELITSIRNPEDLVEALEFLIDDLKEMCDNLLQMV